MATESQRSAAREIIAKETSCGSVPLKGRGLFLSFVDWLGFLLLWNTVPAFRGRAPVSRQSGGNARPATQPCHGRSTFVLDHGFSKTYLGTRYETVGLFASCGFHVTKRVAQPGTPDDGARLSRVCPKRSQCCKLLFSQQQSPPMSTLPYSHTVSPLPWHPPEYLESYRQRAPTGDLSSKLVSFSDQVFLSGCSLMNTSDSQ